MALSIPFREMARVAGRMVLLFAILAIFATLTFAQQTRNVTVAPNGALTYRDSVSSTSTSTIHAGDTIHWIWVAGVSGTHSTTSGNCGTSGCSDTGLWDSGIMSNGTFDHTFPNVGTFPYFCTVHGSVMTGTVVVQAAAAAATTTVVATSGSPSAVGASVTFTATVTSGGGTPAGNVVFKDGAADLGAPVALSGQGVATLLTSALTAGTHSITANYAGNASFSASASPSISQVVKNTTTTGLGSSANPSTSGQAVTFTATVSNAGVVATGNISFRDNDIEMGTGVLNGSGVATLQTSALAVGSHPLTAVYAGDGLNFASTSSTLNQVVEAPLPAVNFQPRSLDFHGVVLLLAGAPQTVTLTNGSGGPVSTSSLQITGDYAQTNDCGPSLAAAAVCTVTITFTPQAMGTRTGQLTLDGANTISLTGVGVEFPLSLFRPHHPPRQE